MLAGIYYGAQYGGSTTAILVNIPGEATAVVTALDGHQMARKGQAGLALGLAAIGSFFAGTVATIMIAAVAGPMTSLGLLFGPAEYFSLMVMGLVFAVVLAHGSLNKAVAMILFGVLLSAVGADMETGRERMTFGMEMLTGRHRLRRHRHGHLRLRAKSSRTSPIRNRAASCATRSGGSGRR